MCSDAIVRGTQCKSILEGLWRDLHILYLHLKQQIGNIIFSEELYNLRQLRKRVWSLSVFEVLLCLQRLGDSNDLFLLNATNNIWMRLEKSMVRRSAVRSFLHCSWRISVPRNARKLYKTSYVRQLWNLYLPVHMTPYCLQNMETPRFGTKMASQYHDKTVMILWVSERGECIKLVDIFVHIVGKSNYTASDGK